ncbi:hypothetical protein T440DRAFT_463226 [Plenodomus tracheiphilus IPT5]|uniref:F-box domain-containing protein n=1 Tax=Plenodomus tracheiphilus IPT5 TaxID=1408161 RepID=A0A6A7BNI0_9PLEO|nr:hypothetical protein T440DRAFT_463226 [Plenodomus tracheiphilus IPT5]
MAAAADLEAGHAPSLAPCLQHLPSELLQLIVARLPTAALKHVALVSRTLSDHATDRLWHSVCLVDQWKLHVDGHGHAQAHAQAQAHAHTAHSLLHGGRRGRGEADEHDDTPIARRLHVLAANPALAAKVHILTHRCHLPTPNIFTELPRMHFDAAHLSQDVRLHALLALALPNLVNVHTLRIVYGHWLLTNALVAGFLHHRRPRRVPLRRLWLESCCLSVDPAQFLAHLQGSALESIRIRRLVSESLASVQTRGMRYLEFKLCRGGNHHPLHNGSGGWVGTSLHLSDEGRPAFWPPHDVQELKSKSEAWDNAIWEGLPDVATFINANRADMEAPLPPCPPVEPLHWLLATSASTLTSLNLDWVLWRRREDDSLDHCMAILDALRTSKFPQLRAFQVRNAVLPHTELPRHVFLFEDTMLGFLEAHPKIQCLGWPLDRFYSHVKQTVDVRNRSRKLVAHLAMMLTDLRVDTQYGGQGEPLTDESTSTEDVQARLRRRRFIAEFAPHLRKVENIKLEGGIPRDEKREILRALHWCPLKKVVMIGVSFPAGNTWGHQGLQLKALDPGQGPDVDYALEEEDLAGILASYKRGVSLQPDFTFEPNYGWPAQAPLVQTIALHHASTIEELKICGYTGCPILSFQTPITGPLLNGLRHYDNLKQLVISLWLVTWYEDSHRDSEIIQSWLDTRSPSSTALTIVTPPASPPPDHPVDPAQFPNFNNPRVAPRAQDFNRWAVALKTRFSPSALAYRVARDIGPYLSPVAKERPGGVRVRASFCLGAKMEGRSAGDIFDLDMRIGSADQVLEYVGPREEGEKGRSWVKLEERRWF